ncbi:MAG: DUF1670 domain-containing protein [Bacillota bacterium]
MGRPKEYKQRLKYQVESVRKKTLHSQIQVELTNNLGLSQIEADLLATDLKDYLEFKNNIFLPGQILISGSKTLNSYQRGGRGNKKSKTIKITPLHYEDLELKLTSGIKALKFNRILRVIEDAAAQDSLLSMRQLTLLFNITPTSLRNIFKDIRQKDIFAPTGGMRKNLRKKDFQFRSTLLIKEYLSTRGDLKTCCSKYFLPLKKGENILQKAAFILKKPAFCKSIEQKQWLRFLHECNQSAIDFLFSYHLPKTAKIFDLVEKLKLDYSYSPVKIKAILLFLNELEFKLKLETKGKTIYHAIAADCRAGEPIDQCELLPVEINFLLPEDEMTADGNRDLNRLKEIKQQKIYRYCQETKNQGAYLSYADLSYLMGINSESLRKLVADCDIKPPLRGFACDMGRGITHKKQIIKLYLEMYTETDIAQRTGHSYEAIEEYIREFAAVYILKQKGLNPALIRKTIGRSRKLIDSYLDLILEYDKPEYAFRFHHLELLATFSEKKREKRGPTKW